jgi:hypothetical protein
MTGQLTLEDPESWMGIFENASTGTPKFSARISGGVWASQSVTDLQYLEVFRSSNYADISLSDWLTIHRHHWSLST